MPLVRCKLGPTQEVVGGTSYDFQIDHDGRAVAEVTDERHLACFVSIDAYELVDAPKAPPPVPTVDPTDDDDPRTDDPSADGTLDGEALVEALNAAVGLTFAAHDDVPYAPSPWPYRVAVPTAMLADLPGFASFADDTLAFDVANGKAGYRLLGLLNSEALFELTDGASYEKFVPPPEVAPPDTTAHATAKDAGLIDVKGIGPTMVEKLRAAGITTLAQLAALDEATAAALDKTLGAKGAVARDDWVGQARAMTAPPDTV